MLGGLKEKEDGVKEKVWGLLSATFQDEKFKI